MRKSRKATINDVAHQAGVSKKTVSRVINNSPLVTRETRAKVEQAIRKLNFAPSPQARGLAFQKSYLLALIYDNPNASYVGDIQQGVLDHCRAEGYELVVHPCDSENEDLLDSVQRFINRSSIDGVIVLPPMSENPELSAMLAKSDCQHVQILSVPLHQPEHMVLSDDRFGVTQIARLLAELGHRRIGFIHGPKTSKSAQERYLGFKDALASHDIKLAKRHTVFGEFTFESGVRCAEKLLHSNPRPTAIFASNDEMALGTLVAAAKLGIDVPLQLSVVGYDDEPHASKLFPSLTTVNQNLRQKGQLAARKLIALCREQNDVAAEIQTMVTPTLVVRESTSSACG